jgi:hypothetical protein
VQLSMQLETDQLDNDAATPLTLSITNSSERPVVLVFNDGQKYEFELLQNGQVVWNWSNGRVFTQAIERRALQPSESEAFTEMWNVLANDGHQVAPGTYVLRAYLTTSVDGTTPFVERTVTVTD